MKKMEVQYLAILMASLYGTAHAAGFALIEQNASGLGNAYAGAAAVAQDASTVYFNPAGMALLPDRQVVMAAHAIKPSAEFSGDAVAYLPSPPYAPGSTTPILGNDGGDAGDWALVPNFYYTHRLTPALTAGIGVNAPFGLKTEYNDGWVGRYQALKSEVKTINVNPSIAWKLNEQVSLGAGISVQRIEATLTNDISPFYPNSHLKVEGDDYGWGFNLGLLWQASKDTRLGLAYRSEVDFTLDGKAKSNAVVPSGKVEADVTMPASASLSLFHKLSPSLDLLADVTWTGWSSLDELAVDYKDFPLTLVTPYNWDSIMRYSIGLTWHMNEAFSLRGGLAYDGAPVSDKYRTARIPDGARTWVAVGGQYRISKQGALDFGYAHLFVEDVDIDLTATGTRLKGSYDSSVDIISVQYTHTF